MRNASEHLDDYVMGKGREEKRGGRWVRNVKREALQSASFDRTTVEWLGVYEDGPVEVFAPVSESDGGRRVLLNIESALVAALEPGRAVRALHPETEPR